jgi:hypothetical protein
MNLFVFCLGGTYGGSHIELHDIRFAVGETAEACHDEMRQQWWGDAAGLHLDAWGILEQADGYDIAVTDTAEPTGAQSLFFVQLGGYDAAEFGELHRNAFVVAPDAAAAKTRALSLVKDWNSPHKDGLVAVEAVLNGKNRHRLRLTPATEPKPFRFTCQYLRLS